MEYFAVNPPPPLVDSPLFWLAVMAIGVSLIWALARRSPSSSSAPVHTCTQPP